MRPRRLDLVREAMLALVRQKARTSLTLLGVAIGAFLLMMSLSVGRGVEAAIVGLFRQDNQLRTISVSPGDRFSEVAVPTDALELPASIPPDQRERLHKAIAEDWRREHGAREWVGLTREAIDSLARLPQVAWAAPVLESIVRASLGGATVEDVRVVGAGPDPNDIRKRLIAGSPLSDPAAREALVHEFLLYRWGLRDPDSMRSVLGRTVRVELEPVRRSAVGAIQVLTRGRFTPTDDQAERFVRLAERLAAIVEGLPLPAEDRALIRAIRESLGGNRTEGAAPSVRIEAEFTIIGVVRAPIESDGPGSLGFDPYLRHGDLIVPGRVVEGILTPEQRALGSYQAFVRVEDDDHVKEVVERIEAMGYTTYSLVTILDRLRSNVTLVSLATASVAWLALIVAALGMVNTMTMSVLERIREIGVMKAVGARDGHVAAIFLVEGFVIGLVGAVIGVGLAYAASFPGDAIARGIMERQTEGHAVTVPLFVFPPLLVVGIPLAAAGLTTLAAMLPARRAARLDPVAALRHE